MATGDSVCPKCGATVLEAAIICPECHALLEEHGPSAPESPPEQTPDPPPAATPPLEEVPPRRPAAPRSRPARAAPSEKANPFAAELGRRLSRLKQWSEGVQALGVELPKLPEWAEELARSAPNPEPWAEVVRGIERIAQKRIVEAFEEWEKRTKVRLTRLEAYSVDSRLERDQIEDALHSAHAGDIAQALSSFQQVDRVVTLKERHLDQAREELERVVSLLHDMQALGIDPPQDVTEVADDLESELRAGKLAPLKQQIRAIRLQAVTRLKAGLPQYVSEYGDYLLSERAHGVATELEAIELARGAREFFRGRPEDGVRRLRALQQRHGMLPNRSVRSVARSTSRSP
ncbi:MAG TPA: zinc ribbon domain-containing protein [Thermoplasmata archaeon]|nr:zinc ribbon domain-containing protein [Thermoplasmata archaeon]